MKDRARLVTLIALIGLVVVLGSLDGGLPSLEILGDSIFWVLFGVLIFFLVRGKGCCCSPAPRKDA